MYILSQFLRAALQRDYVGCGDIKSSATDAHNTIFGAIQKHAIELGPKLHYACHIAGSQ